ncbi:MAG: DUF2807 domain-containing protein [Ferruginibacter sp.]|nr:DUF2807 domain-containing protein [Ferruginibacter sp.]
MKNIQLNKYSMLMCIAVLFLAACNKESIRGEGAVSTENRNVPSFTQVQLDGDAEATISYGPTQKVSVTAYQNLLPVYETKIVGGVLHLGFKSGHRIRNSNVRVAIEIPVLSFMRIDGSGKMTGTNFQQGEMLENYVNGSGSIIVQQCAFDKAVYDVNGSGSITATTSDATVANAEIHGSGQIRLRVSNELDASIHGSGVIEYWGNPATVNSHVSGSGQINKK